MSDGGGATGHGASRPVGEDGEEEEGGDEVEEEEEEEEVLLCVRKVCYPELAWASHPHLYSTIKRELGSGDCVTSSVASVPSLICCFMPLLPQEEEEEEEEEEEGGE